MLLMISFVFVFQLDMRSHQLGRHTNGAQAQAPQGQRGAAGGGEWERAACFL